MRRRCHSRSFDFKRRQSSTRHGLPASTLIADGTLERPPPPAAYFVDAGGTWRYCAQSRRAATLFHAREGMIFGHRRRESFYIEYAATRQVSAFARRCDDSEILGAGDYYSK